MLRFHHTFSQTFNLWKELAPCRSRFLRSQSRTPFPLSHLSPLNDRRTEGRRDKCHCMYQKMTPTDPMSPFRAVLSVKAGSPRSKDIHRHPASR